jgi:outer membrane protein assembly factor BamE (lipoprotein component of BamABCDE complex)
MRYNLLAGLFCFALVGCASQVQQHGHVFTQADIEQVQEGMAKDQVKLALGSPDTTSTADGSAFYYISSKKASRAFFTPKVIDRRILAVYFDKSDNVRKVANYGLKDGKVFDFISRTTPSQGRDFSVLQQILGNIGKRVSPVAQ